jgi:hypothetical protein
MAGRIRVCLAVRVVATISVFIIASQLASLLLGHHVGHKVLDGKIWQKPMRRPEEVEPRIPIIHQP